MELDVVLVGLRLHQHPHHVQCLEKINYILKSESQPKDLSVEQALVFDVSANFIFKALNVTIASSGEFHLFL